ncbi:MAG: hypothetical protein ABI559_10805 [Chloroflexota bacterium]
MGRTIMYAALAVLAVLVISALFVLKHGESGIASPKGVTLHELTTGPDFYNKHNVSTNGQLQYDDSRKEYVLIDTEGEGQNFAVVVRQTGGPPIASLVGRVVQVQGIFGYEPVTGTFIDNAYVDVLSTATAAPGGI